MRASRLLGEGRLFFAPLGVVSSEAAPFSRAQHSRYFWFVSFRENASRGGNKDTLPRSVLEALPSAGFLFVWTWRRIRQEDMTATSWELRPAESISAGRGTNTPSRKTWNYRSFQ